MQQIGLWRITDRVPNRITPSNVGLEQNLEEWIAQDAALLQSGLTVIGRQIDLGDAGRLDLLALDQQGQWVVIEIKRGELYRDTIAQAIDYASAIASMSFDALAARLNHRGSEANITALLEQRGVMEEADNKSRPIRIIVVGTGRAPVLQRMIDFLTDRISIEAVLFQVFEVEGGDRILVREIVEQVDPAPSDKYKPRPLDELRACAHQNGVGCEFDMILAAGERNGLYARTWKNSVMLAPQQNKSRALVTVWANLVDQGRIFVFVAAPAFAEFFDVAEEQARDTLQPFDQWQHLTSEQVTQLVGKLDTLFKLINQPESDGCGAVAEAN